MLLGELGVFSKKKKIATAE
jgi:hypothetical protein